MWYSLYNEFTQWTELSYLHMESNRWDYALFCFEELALLQPANPRFHALAAECLLRLNQNAPRNNKQKEQWVESLLEARRHAAHAVRLSHGLYGRAAWVLAVACVSIATAAKTSLNGEEILSEDQLERGDVKKSPALMTPISEASETLVNRLVSYEEVSFQELKDKSLCKSDKNVSLFLYARDALRKLYQSTVRDLQVNGIKNLGDLGCRDSDITIIPEVCGNWKDLVPLLDQWFQTVVLAAQEGLTSTGQFSEAK